MENRVPCREPALVPGTDRPEREESTGTGFAWPTSIHCTQGPLRLAADIICVFGVVYACARVCVDIPFRILRNDIGIEEEVGGDGHLKNKVI